MTMIDREWTRPAPTRRQVEADVVLAVGVALVCLASVAIFRSAYGTAGTNSGVEAYVWFGLAGLLLAGRRVLPLPTVLAESAVFIVVGERMEDLAGVFTIQMILFAALYGAWAWSRHKRLLWATSGVVLVAMFGWLIWAFTQPGTLPRTASVGLLPREAAIITYSLAINVVYFLGAMAWGQAAWRSARRNAVIEEQIERERGRQDVDRSNAVRAERVRIARDLHDVVAHHVSSIGIQSAGARRVLERDPAQASAALGTIEQSSRQAVAQMHQLVGLLREADVEPETAGGRGPQPGLADIALLADPHGTPRVEVREVGEVVDVPATTGLNLFRVVQESLTNARRHAAARVVQVTLRYLDHAVEVEVIDDGRGCADGPKEGSGGFGLAGIRERAAMLGGEVEIGDRPHGGFRVRVRVATEGDEA
ncbi:MAG: sensor histidine kinase [Actinomycetales bacterium]|nr:MAG: sensor histidine kinase [Actinomycetales bacterium]